jgi:hypothetical protein
VLKLELRGIVGDYRILGARFERNVLYFGDVKSWAWVRAKKQ